MELIWEQEAPGSNPAIPTDQRHYSKLLLLSSALVAGGRSTPNVGRRGLLGLLRWLGSQNAGRLAELVQGWKRRSDERQLLREDRRKALSSGN
jgi:hypothetical protein